MYVGYIARWNGTAWNSVAGGTGARVLSMCLFDHDGPGLDEVELYVGGAFSSAGGITANRVARWNGTIWAPLGIGTNDFVLSMAQFNDGLDPVLYLGGNLTIAGGVPTNHLARWGCPPQPSIPADLNGDGVVNTLDLGILLSSWSIPPESPACAGAIPCPADLDGSGFVNSLDLGVLLSNWTL